ncbi:hypothetical protein PJM41_0053 [Salmonella phage vB_SenS_UTK0009]|uniref:Uncharacterized protein n=1 Tax=Salmonella phage vB_SenS_UTK0009 TaxID=3028908 RepID=A0AAE9ZK47_9CAUD|nr:hypothetical protein PJM41_0053 [Salmonella phage vB_SenS_UTK0009]
MKLSELEISIREFVSGYIAGSCNSYDHCLDVLKSEHPTVDSDLLETLLNNEIEVAGIFICDTCSWWCWDHEHSSDYDVCSDCHGDNEDD